MGNYSSTQTLINKTQSHNEYKQPKTSKALTRIKGNIYRCVAALMKVISSQSKENGDIQPVKNNSSSNKEEQKHNSNNNQFSEHDEEMETDRFFQLLHNVKNTTDDELRESLSKFPKTMFTKVWNAANELNIAIQRISSLLSYPTLPQHSNGYPLTSKSSAESILKKKKFKKRKRKKPNKSQQLMKPKYEYEHKIEPKLNREHESQVKKYILNEKWYNKMAIRNAGTYGAAKPNGRITLSLEVSEFMRRCQKFVIALENNPKNIHLIPLHMRDSNKLCVQYLVIVTIDTLRKIDIGVSFKCNSPCDKLAVEVTGIHLNPKHCGLSAEKYDLNRFRIGNLKIYGQTEEHYQERYNKMLPLVQELIRTEPNNFVFEHWRDKAKTIWKMI